MTCGSQGLCPRALHTPGPGGGADRLLGKRSSCRASTCLRGSLRTGHEAGMQTKPSPLPASLPLDPPVATLTRKVQGHESPCPSQQVAKPPCPVATIESARARRERSSNPSLAYLNSQQERSQSTVASPPDPRRCLLLLLYYLVSSNNRIINGRIKPFKDQKRKRSAKDSWASASTDPSSCGNKFLQLSLTQGKAEVFCFVLFVS